MVGSATQADPLPSAVRPTRLTARRRLRVGEPNAGRAPEVQRGHILFGKARQHGVAGAGAPERARQRGQHAFERAGIGRLGVEPEVTRRPGLRRLDEREGIRGRRRILGVGQGRGRHLRHAVRADLPAAPGGADRRHPRAQ